MSGRRLNATATTAPQGATARYDTLQEAAPINPPELTVIGAQTTSYQTQDPHFWGRFQASDFGCLEWTGALDAGGYGVVRVGGRAGKVVKVHRRAFELTRGQIPAGALVCHHCDNRACGNPDHLFLGDHKANFEDMRRKGRGYFPGSKGLSAEVRQLLSEGSSALEVSRRLGLSRSSVHRQKKRLHSGAA